MAVRDEALDGRVVLLAGAFEEVAMPFAFGGALALAYYGEPRATVDIDLNVFVAVDRSREVFVVVDALGAETSADRLERLITEGQVRLRWGTYPLDLFLSTHPFHDSCARRIRRVPFGDGEIPILSAEDLMVLKILFNRPKDWFDVEQVLFAQAGRFDVGYVEHWLQRLIGGVDVRTARFEEALRSASGSDLA